jgi:iron complex transport system ATP-binding protein
MIKLENVNVTKHRKEILKNITCTLQKGKFYCLIGTNGSGKTTILRAIMGLCNYQGNIYVNKINIQQIPKKERAKYISYLPQNRVTPNIDVYTLIAHGRYPHLGFSKVLTSNDDEKIKYAAKISNVSHLLDREVASLSGGERQRTYIAMLIAQDADILLLDEITTYLDIEHQLELLEVLRKLCTNGKGIVMVLHDLPQAFSIADEVLLLSKGEIMVVGKPDDIYKDSAITQSFGVSLKKSTDLDEIYDYQLKR